MESSSERGSLSCQHQDELSESTSIITGTSESSSLPANKSTSRLIKSVNNSTLNRLMLTRAYGSSCEIEDDYEKGSEESIERVKELENIYRSLLTTVGEDANRPGLLKTPERAAKALWYFTKGYRQDFKGKNFLTNSRNRLRGSLFAELELMEWKRMRAEESRRSIRKRLNTFMMLGRTN